MKELGPGHTEVSLDRDEMMEVMKKVIAKDEALSASQVSRMLKDVLKPGAGLVPGYDGEPDFSDELLEELEEAAMLPEGTSLNDDIAEGMGIIFGGVEEGPLSTELAWLADPKHDKDDQLIMDRLEAKGVVHIGTLDLDEIDHLIFFLELLDNDTGPWYYYRVAIPFSNACMDRLAELSKVEEAELEDEAMMDAAMKGVRHE